MKISVALCTYNGAKYLPEQLESLARQTRLPDEVVICDDGSTDVTVSLIESFVQDAPFPVRLFINETNIGSCKNFERAIGLCAGEVIALSDQDDVWLPPKLERIESKFASEPEAGLVFSNAILTDEDLKPLRTRLWQLTFSRRDRRKFEMGKALDVLLEHNVVTGATMAFRSKLRSVFLPFPGLPGLIHDGWISLAVSACSEVRFISEPLIKYRQHPGQQLGLYFPGIGSSVRRRHAAFIGQKHDAIARLDEMERMIRKGVLFSGQQAAKSVDTANLLERIQATKYFVRQSMAHYEIRKQLPGSYVRRAFAIFRELASGRYHKYSSGFLSAAVDLIGER